MNPLDVLRLHYKKETSLTCRKYVSPVLQDVAELQSYYAIPLVSGLSFQTVLQGVTRVNQNVASCLQIQTFISFCLESHCLGIIEILNRKRDIAFAIRMQTVCFFEITILENPLLCDCKGRQAGRMVYSHKSYLKTS